MQLRNVTLWNRDGSAGGQTTLVMKNANGTTVAALRGQATTSEAAGGRLQVDVPAAGGLGGLTSALVVEPYHLDMAQRTTVSQLGLNNQVALSTAGGTLILTPTMAAAPTLPGQTTAAPAAVGRACQLAIYSKSVSASTVGLGYGDLGYGPLAFPVAVVTCDAVGQANTTEFTLKQPGLYHVTIQLAVTNQPGVAVTQFEAALTWSPGGAATVFQNYGYHVCGGDALLRHERHAWLQVTTPGVTLSVLVIPDSSGAPGTTPIREWGFDTQPMHVLTVQYLGANTTG